MKTLSTVELSPLLPVSGSFRQAGTQGSVQGFSDQMSGLAQMLSAENGTTPTPAASQQEDAAAEANNANNEAGLAEDLTALTEESSEHPDRSAHSESEAELEAQAELHEKRPSLTDSHLDREQAMAADENGQAVTTPVASKASETSADPIQVPAFNPLHASKPMAATHSSSTAAADLLQVASNRHAGSETRQPVAQEVFSRLSQEEAPIRSDQSLRLELGRGRELDPALLRWLQSAGNQASHASATASEQITSSGNHAMLAAVRSTTPSEWSPIRVADQAPHQWGRDLAAALGERLSMQVRQNVQEARVRLDPPELGRIEMTVRLEGDRLNVQLHANQGQVRELLAQHAERLRLDLMEQHGQSVDVHVGAETGRHGSSPARPEQERIERGLQLSSDETGTDPLTPDTWLSTKA